VFSFVNYAPFARWANDPTGDRSWEYEKLKETLKGRILGTLDARIPGLKEAVVFAELGTPVTNSHYVNTHQGNIYGIARDRWQIGPLGFGNKTEIEGLYLCGASTLSHGVAAATDTGLMAAAEILGCRANELLNRNGPALRVYPCEDLSQWPTTLQERAARGLRRPESARPEAGH
jgi:phytoene dehydrogenase-like protein